MSLKETTKNIIECADELISYGNSREKAEGYGNLSCLKRLWLTAEEIELIDKERSGSRHISWSVGDFANQAEKSPGKYNKYKFEKALDLMISEHDATIGINWGTIDSYLDKYCLNDKRERRIE
ncbi:MAG: hypothetical protein U9N34_03715 [Candidatus Cloacimonadota bacterium]|nr:hypothetical protein [Candidatus Cloacimonadota bacterium]